MTGRDLRKEISDTIVLLFILLIGAIVIGSIAEITGDPFDISEKYEFIVVLILAASSISLILLVARALKGLVGGESRPRI